MREKLAEALGLGCIYRKTGRFSRGRAVRFAVTPGMAKADRGPVGRGHQARAADPGAAHSQGHRPKTGGAGEPGSLGGKRGERENGASRFKAHLDTAAGPRQSATCSQSQAAETTRRAPQSLVRSPGRDPRTPTKTRPLGREPASNFRFRLSLPGSARSDSSSFPKGPLNSGGCGPAPSKALLGTPNLENRKIFSQSPVYGAVT